MRSDHNLKPVAPRNQVSQGGGASDLVRDRFLANICHELRTPINGVIGMLELLIDTQINDDQRMYASTAQRSAEHLLMLIDELLDLSLLESGTLALQESSFDLREELESLIHSHMETARQHGCDLSVVCSVAEGTRVVGDAVRLKQLVASLLDGTLKKNPNIALELTLDASIETGGYWHLELVLSNSAGPLHCDADGLSWRFTQSLAEHLGTRIELDDGYGYASLKLTLDLPAAPDTLAGMRMLFVADGAEQCRALEAELSRSGIRAEGYASAADALKELKQATLNHDPYRIVMLGRKMQGIDGELLGRAIIADPAYRATRFVLLSSEEPVNEQKLAAAGFAAVVRPPIAARDLIGTLARLVDAGAKEAAQAETVASPHTFAGRRVLVADDHVVNQQIAARMLAKFGCEVEVAADGREAIAMHEAQRYDLILMDCQMPVLDGYQATARIRAMETGEGRTPVIGWTAFALQEERQRCLGAGMDDFMAKPLRPRPLYDMLAKWLARGTPRPPANDAMAADDELESMQEIFGPDFADLARLFMNDSPKRIEALRNAAAEPNAALLVKLAHAFSGSTASIGANGLSALCKSFEADARAGELGGAAAALDAIEKEYARIESRLKQLIA
ncbi:MAG TPA: response regulator [Paucimonas sp.]|nr:response regulator [Paucimonas sp.]